MRYFAIQIFFLIALELSGVYSNAQFCLKKRQPSIQIAYRCDNLPQASGTLTAT